MPTAVITSRLGSALMVPCRCKFDGLASTTEVASIDKVLGADYIWTITQTGVGVIYNAYGFIMGYVFETPGEFTVQLTIRQEGGATHSAQTVVTVAAFSGTIRYQSAGGSDSNDGTTEGTAWLTIGKVVAEVNAAIAGNPNLRYKVRVNNTSAFNSGSGNTFSGTVNQGPSGGLVIIESYDFAIDSISPGAEWHSTNAGSGIFLNLNANCFRFVEMEISGPTTSHVANQTGVNVSCTDVAFIRGETRAFGGQNHNHNECTEGAYWYHSIHDCGEYNLYSSGTFHTTFTNMIIHTGNFGVLYGLMRMNEIQDSCFWNCNIYKGTGLSTVAYPALNTVSSRVYIGGKDSIWQCLVSMGQGDAGEPFPFSPDYVVVEDITIKQVDGPAQGEGIGGLEFDSGINYQGHKLMFRNIQFVGSLAAASKSDFRMFICDVASSGMANFTEVYICNCSCYKEGGEAGGTIYGRLIHVSSSSGSFAQLNVTGPHINNCVFHHALAQGAGDTTGPFMECPSAYDYETHYRGNRNFIYFPNHVVANAWLYEVGVGYRTLASWQSATGEDANSTVGVNPQFTSSTDLRPASTSSPIYQTGISLPYVHRDRLGVARSATPSIGAYEMAFGGSVYVVGTIVENVVSSSADVTVTSTSWAATVGANLTNQQAGNFPITPGGSSFEHWQRLRIVLNDSTSVSNVKFYRKTGALTGGVFIYTSATTTAASGTIWIAPAQTLSRSPYLVPSSPIRNVSIKNSISGVITQADPSPSYSDWWTSVVGTDIGAAAGITGIVMAVQFDETR